MTSASDQIKAEIKQGFAKVAISRQEERNSPIGPDSAKRLGYGTRIRGPIARQKRRGIPMLLLNRSPTGFPPAGERAI